MRYSYDISTKDKEISYANLVDKYLLDLGFGINKNGTKYLRDLILTVYFNQDYDFFVDSMVDKFLSINKINTIDKNSFLRAIKYSIQTIDNKKAKKNFFSILQVDYDYYFLTTRNLTILINNVLRRTGK